MAGIRSATQAPELLLPPNVGFQQYLEIHPDAADLSDTNVYFPLGHYDVR